MATNYSLELYLDPSSHKDYALYHLLYHLKLYFSILFIYAFFMILTVGIKFS